MRVAFFTIIIVLQTINCEAQNNHFNPQINLIGYNSWGITPKNDSTFRKYYYSMYDLGTVISNTFFSNKIIYLEIGGQYNSYGQSCCKGGNSNGYSISKYRVISTFIKPEYYFKKKYFVGLSINVNWIIFNKTFQSHSKSIIPVKKDIIIYWWRKEMPKSIVSTTFSSLGFYFGKEILINNRQTLIFSFYAESPFKSINKFTAEISNGYFIYRNIGISLGYGLRSKKYFH